jgi:signal transduction histidine kinase
MTLAAIAWAAVMLVAALFVWLAVRSNEAVSSGRAEVAQVVGLLIAIDAAATQADLDRLQVDLRANGFGPTADRIAQTDPTAPAALSTAKQRARMALRSRNRTLSRELAAHTDTVQTLLYASTAFASGTVALGGIALVQIRRRDDLLATLADHELDQRVLEERDAFTLSVTHDLRSPLRAINGFAALLVDALEADAQPDPARLREWVGHIRDAGLQMDSLLDGLFALARVGRAQSRDAYRVDTLVRKQANALEAELAAAGGRVDCPSDLPRVVGAHVELTRLFQNLLENAIRYREPGRSLVIRVSAQERDPGWVHVVVADNGIGIRPVMRDRVFEPFVRDVSDSGAVGTGLGLAICKKVVEAHGGAIWLMEANPGTEVHFTLPRAPSPE